MALHLVSLEIYPSLTSNYVKTERMSTPKIYDVIFILFSVTEISPQQTTTFPTLHLAIEWDLLNVKTFSHESVWLCGLCYRNLVISQFLSLSSWCAFYSWQMIEINKFYMNIILRSWACFPTATLIIDISHFSNVSLWLFSPGHCLFVSLSVCLSFPFAANLKWQLFATAPQCVQYEW